MGITKPIRRTRRGLLAVLATALVLVLAGCNPLTEELKVDAQGRDAPAKFRYIGTTEAWFEVAITGAAGMDVVTMSVIVGASLPRECAADLQLVPCLDAEGEGVASPMRILGTQRGVSRAAIRVRPGETVNVAVLCFAGGAPVSCLPVKVVGKAVTAFDGSGTVVGDLADVRFT